MTCDRIEADSSVGERADHMKMDGQRVPGRTLVLFLSEGVLIGGELLFAAASRFFSFDTLRQQLREPGAPGIR